MLGLSNAKWEEKEEEQPNQDKGRHRCEQFRHTDESEWKVTVKRIENLDSTPRREDMIGGRHKILKSHHVESEFI
jgi:hypothetical protein